MSRSVVRQFLTLMLILGVPCTHAADGSVVIEAPAGGMGMGGLRRNAIAAGTIVPALACRSLHRRFPEDPIDLWSK